MATSVTECHMEWRPLVGKFTLEGPMGVFWSYSGFSVNELAAGRGAGVIGG